MHPGDNSGAVGCVLIADAMDNERGSRQRPHEVNVLVNSAFP